ncbi:prepilin-type N-terminal cleavage/methylation domain-containing protein [Candidatus Saccharibacteria bacterium]|nr:prepilin-type N-terminal cleavage/methylation domain-containing protein [Candidatus Saccharibacteria bacterium]
MRVRSLKSGFTIVELLIVIVVLGILAVIAIGAFSNSQKQAQDTAVRSDVQGAAKAMETVYADTGSFPTQLPSTVNTSPNVGLSLSTTGSSDSFCINGHDITNANVRWFYQKGQGAKAGSCTGSTIPLSEKGIPANLVTDSNFTNLSASGWWLNIQGGTAGVTLATRPGQAGDPDPSRPVLTVTNTTSKTVSWAILSTPQLLHSSILNGDQIERSYYVRKIGGFTGGTSIFGIMDSNGTNTTISNGSHLNTNTTWTKVSGTATAQRNATSGNNVYLSMNTGSFTATGWTLEFQDIQVNKQ